MTNWYVAVSRLRTVYLAKLLAIGLAIGLLINPGIGFAQKKTDASAEQRRAEQLRKLSAQNQQLESEKAALMKEKNDVQVASKLVEDKSKEAQGKNSKLIVELTALRSKNVELDKTSAAITAEIQKLNAQLLELRELTKNQQTQIEQRVQTIAALTDANSKLGVQNKDLNAVSAVQKDRGQALTLELTTCSKNNVALVGLVDEVSERYRKKSCGDMRSLLEPLMGLRAAEFERVSEEYRAKAGDERYVLPLVKP